MFFTQADESKIMFHGRIYCTLFGLICTTLTFLIFKVRFQINSFWIFRNSEELSINLPYFGLLVAIIFLIYMHYEPFTLKIQRFDFKIPKVKGKIKIAHLSDTHVHYPYPQVTESRLTKIFEIINKENPDFVVYTGDLMSDKSKYSDRDILTITNSLQTLKSPCFVCFGNHDVECHDDLKFALKSIGITTLEQETTEISIGKNKLFISGLKPSLILPETEHYIKDIATNFKGDRTIPHLLLSHMPDAADMASKSGLFDLQLSGHSHGGQCVLPFNGGTPLLPPGCLKYHACVTSNYIVGKMILHISRGVGVTPLPFPLIRFLCKPEISIITLTE